MQKLIIIGSEKSIVHNHCIHNSLISLKKYHQKFINNNINVEYYINSDENEIKNLINKIKTSNEYNNSIIIFHQIAGYNYFKDLDILKNKNIKKILIFNDTHTERYINHLSLVYFDKILFNSLTFVKLFYTQYLEKIHLFPFSMCNDYMKNITLDNRINQVLLYGAINKDIYPLRTHLYNLYTKNPKKYIKVHQHFGSVRNKKHNNIGLKFCKNTLSKYKGAIATSSKYPMRYLVSKYVEILGSGCLGFFEYHEELDILGFKPYVHYIPINTITTEKYITKDGAKQKQFDLKKMENTILKYLGTPKGEEIRKNGYQFVLDNFSDLQRLDEIINIIKSLK